MDELRIQSKFMRSVVSKLLGIAIKQKLGYKVDIQINELEVVLNDGGTARIHINADAGMKSDELKKITKVIGVEEES